MRSERLLNEVRSRISKRTNDKMHSNEITVDQAFEYIVDAQDIVYDNHLTIEEKIEALQKHPMYL